jgi:hypothetical protein
MGVDYGNRENLIRARTGHLNSRASREAAKWDKRKGKGTTKTVSPELPRSGPRPYDQGVTTPTAMLPQAPPPPPDPMLAALQGLLGSGGTATPAVSLSQYLQPFDAAQDSLNKAAMLGHAEIERNHQALTAALAARQGASSQNVTDYQHGLGASTNAATAEINPVLAHLGHTPQEQAAAAEGQTNLAALAAMQRDMGAAAGQSQKDDALSRSQTADDIHAAALNAIAANQNQAQTGIATGRANAASQYQQQVAAAGSDAQNNNLDVLKAIISYQNGQANNAFRQDSFDETKRHDRATEGGNDKPPSNVIAGAANAAAFDIIDEAASKGKDIDAAIRAAAKEAVARGGNAKVIYDYGDRYK